MRFILVGDQEVGGSNPLAPTIVFNELPRTPGLSVSVLWAILRAVNSTPKTHEREILTDAAGRQGGFTPTLMRSVSRRHEFWNDEGNRQPISNWHGFIVERVGELLQEMDASPPL